MSISSIVQIASRFLNGDSGQDSQGQGKNKLAAAQAQNNRTEFGDRFTPSARGEAANAEAGAVFFQAEQLRFTAINIQTPAGNTAATTVATGAAPVTAVAQPAVAPNTVAPTTAAATPAVATSSPIQAQQDLQGLNASLAALGLNAAEIAAFDQFAGVLLQFDPNALQDLQNQLNLLASRFRAQNAAPAATPQTPAVSPNFQLTELSISFSGLNGTLTQGNPGTGDGTTTQFSAFSLRIQEVRVTLSNSAGETTQLRVPQANPANVATAAPAASAATA
ncbi:MAG TPA: hypothetical protein VNH19_10640 [Candidatus Limnocylindrales bacterium]|nr:hypothetical protein [Candidatus Limnocylindrales bacterium]